MSAGHTLLWDHDGLIHATCSCRRWVQEPLMHRWQVEDSFRGHEVRVETEKAGAARRAVGLPATLRYYRQMEADPNASDLHREQWGRMADEIDSRIKTKTLTNEDQPTLF